MCGMVFSGNSVLVVGCDGGDLGYGPGRRRNVITGRRCGIGKGRMLEVGCVMADVSSLPVQGIRRKQFKTEGRQSRTGYGLAARGARAKPIDTGDRVEPQTSSSSQ